MPDSPLTRLAPFTGFNGALFGFPDDAGTGVLPGWKYDTRVTRRHIPGGNITILQSSGVTDAEATWRVHCDTEADFLVLQSKLLTTGILTVLDNIQAMAGTRKTIQPHVYRDIPNVMLVAITDIAVSIEGWVEATCTFVAPFNPLTGGTT